MSGMGAWTHKSCKENNSFPDFREAGCFFIHHSKTAMLNSHEFFLTPVKLTLLKMQYTIQAIMILA